MRSLTADVVALQHAAEAVGARFQAVPGARGLVGTVSSADELLVVQEGLLVSPALASAALEPGPCVVVQPVERGLPAGFERIDLNHAAAGLMRLPGALTERLGELPPDCDPASALQRIALQAGVPQRAMPAGCDDQGQWELIRDEAAAHTAEARWITLHTSEDTSGSPARWLSRFAVRRAGPALLHAGSGGAVVTAAALALLLFALGAGWFGVAFAAFLLCAAAFVLKEAAHLLLGIERDSLRTASWWLPRPGVFLVLVDAVLVAVAVWCVPPPAAQPLLDHLFAPLILVALVRLVPPTLERRWRGALEDRAVLALVLAGAVLGDVLDLALKAVPLAYAAIGLAAPLRRELLTRA